MVWIFPTMKRIREKEALRLPVLTEIGVLRRFEEQFPPFPAEALPGRTVEQQVPIIS